MLFQFRASSHPRLKQLKSIVLFKDLSNHELEVVNNLFHERHYQAGEVIFDQNEEGQGLFIVLSGRVQTKRVGTDNRVMLEFGAGSFFGEIALLDESPRTAQARAIEDTIIVVLFRAEFLSLLDTHNGVAARVFFQLARVLANRLRLAISANHRLHDAT